MQNQQYDRAAQDVGNIVNLGHVNVCISDQHVATHYYVTGLGLTRDPYLNTGAGNMWINVGMSQFHLPMGPPEVLRGVIGLVVPERQALLDRLTRIRKALGGTKFEFRESNDCVETVCPWGNRINLHSPDKDRFGRIQLGMPYVRFDVRPGTAARIARFYREVLDAPADVIKNGAGPEARVQVGEKQYRFKDLIDRDGGKVLFTIEHETRSQTNPMYGRPLVNRNPAQTNTNYKPGHDSLSWALP